MFLLKRGCICVDIDVNAGIPADIDILITHTPPHAVGGLDKIHDGTSVGCEELTRKLTDDREIRPMLHLFGHIHEARGVHIHPHAHTASPSQTTAFVNASMVDYDAKLWEAEKKCKFTYIPSDKSTA